MLQVLDESLHLHLALLLSTSHADVVTEVLLAFDAELGPQVLHERIHEEAETCLLTVFVEDFEKVGCDLSKVISHWNLDG